MISYRQADIFERMKNQKEIEDFYATSLDVPDAKFHRGDRVKLNESGKRFLFDDLSPKYFANVGTVVATLEEEDYDHNGFETGRIENKVHVKWDKPVGPKDNISIWREDSLDMA